MKTKTITLFTVAALLAGAAAAQTQGQSTNLNGTLINTDPAPVQSGEDAEITFKIRNTGNSDAENVQVQLIDSFPFQVKPDRKKNYSLGDVAPGQEYQISTELLVADDAPDGRNDFKIRIVREDFSFTQDIPVQVQSQDIELNLANLKTSPTQLTPDTEDAKMTLEVVNNGEKTAENAVVNIELPEGFEETSSFSTRQSLGNIPPGQMKTAEFNFDIEEDAMTGEKKVPTEITYSTGDSSQRVAEETDFSFNLAGKPQFEVTNVESNLKQGSTGQLEVKVRNKGDEQSASTRIRVLDSSELPFSYDSSSQYIGTLEPNQTGTAIFDITMESDAEAKNYLLDFEIRGVKDTQVYAEDTTVQTEVENGEQRGSILPLIAVLLFAGGLVYLFRERIGQLLNR